MSVVQFCKIYADDNNTLTYSITDHYTSPTTGEHVEMRIEKDENTDIYAEFTMPALHCHHAYGFSEDELFRIEQFLKNNAVLIWDMAREVTAHA